MLLTLCHAPTIMLTATVKEIAVKDVTKLATDGVSSCVTTVTPTLTLTLTVERKVPLFA